MNFTEYKNLNASQKLDYFIKTLSLTNRTPKYYVNWDKVNRNTKNFEKELHALNYLIGKEDIVKEAKELFEEQPHLLRAIPSLIASRDFILDVLLLRGDNMDIINVDFMNIDTNNINLYVRFMEESGLLSFLKYNANRSLVDYVYGVETGLDSNARKNRSGTTMEGILTIILKSIAEKLDLKHMEQATPTIIQEEWGVTVPSDKSQRRFDGALFNPQTKKTYIFETNYYGGAGSKLKAVAGEFKDLNNLINTSPDDVTFIWVTDGQGWKTTKKPMEEAMGTIKYIYNLKMIEDGFLYETIISD